MKISILYRVDGEGDVYFLSWEQERSGLKTETLIIIIIVLIIINNYSLKSR